MSLFLTYERSDKLLRTVHRRNAKEHAETPRAHFYTSLKRYSDRASPGGRRTVKHVPPLLPYSQKKRATPSFAAERLSLAHKAAEPDAYASSPAALF